MSKEKSQQYDMFTGELVDTGSKRPKPENRTLQQTEMFAPREVLQFGVKSNPSLPSITATGKPLELRLEVQDFRTEDEKEADRMKAAEAATYQLFEAKEPIAEFEDAQLLLFPSGRRFELRFIESNKQVEALAVIHLDEGVDLPYWSSRDEGYEWTENQVRKRGYIPKVAGEVQLELRKTDESGSFVVTYSRITEQPVNVVVNVAWEAAISR